MIGYFPYESIEQVRERRRRRLQRRSLYPNAYPAPGPAAAVVRSGSAPTKGFIADFVGRLLGRPRGPPNRRLPRQKRQPMSVATTQTTIIEDDRIQKLIEERDALKAQLVQTQKQCTECRTACQKAESGEQARLNQIIATQTAQLVKLNQDLATNKQQIVSIQADYAKTQQDFISQMEKSRDNLTRMKTNAQAAAKKLNDKDADIKKYQLELAAQQKQINEYKAEFEQKNNRIANLELDWKTAREVCRNFGEGKRKEIARINSEWQQKLDKAINNANNEYKQLSTIDAETFARLEKTKDELVKAAQQKCNEQIAKLNQEMAAAKAKFDQNMKLLQQQLKDCVDERQLCAKNLNDCIIKRDDLKKQLKQLQQPQLGPASQTLSDLQIEEVISTTAPASRPASSMGRPQTPASVGSGGNVIATITDPKAAKRFLDELDMRARQIRQNNSMKAPRPLNHTYLAEEPLILPALVKISNSIYKQQTANGRYAKLSELKQVAPEIFRTNPKIFHKIPVPTFNESNISFFAQHVFLPYAKQNPEWGIWDTNILVAQIAFGFGVGAKEVVQWMQQTPPPLPAAFIDTVFQKTEKTKAVLTKRKRTHKLQRRPTKRRRVTKRKKIYGNR